MDYRFPLHLSDSPGQSWSFNGALERYIVDAVFRRVKMNSRRGEKNFRMRSLAVLGRLLARAHPLFPPEAAVSVHAIEFDSRACQLLDAIEDSRFSDLAGFFGENWLPLFGGAP